MKKGIKIMLIGIAIMFCIVLLPTGSTYTETQKIADIALGIIMIGGSIMAYGLYYYSCVENKRENDAKKFYQILCENNIHNLDTEKNMEIAIDILKYRLHIQNPTKITAKSYYNQGKEIIKEHDTKMASYAKEQEDKKNNEELQKEKIKNTYLTSGSKALIEKHKDNVSAWLNALEKQKDKNILAIIQCNNFHLVILKGPMGPITYIVNTQEIKTYRPTAYIKQFTTSEYKYVPEEYTYSSATSGGFTVGGVTKHEAHFVEKQQLTGYYGVFIGFGTRKEAEWQLNSLYLSDEYFKAVIYNSQLKKDTINGKNAIRCHKTSWNICDDIVKIINNIK